MRHGGEEIQVAGAGPAGLAAAITLARAGRRVVVHEARGSVGGRFNGDLQGLENWSTRQDVLAWLRALGLTTDFDHVPHRRGTVYDAWGGAHPVRASAPLFYMVERGPGPRTIDSALLAQARALGVEVRLGSRLDRVSGPAILATGPKAADAIAVGYHFETDLPDGFWGICDNRLAPGGYAYLLIMGGRGTVKTCMFRDFHRSRHYVARTVAAFERLVGLRMVNPRPHGGVGNFHIPDRALSGRHPVAGEQAGFQDTLWGFGMRPALWSGVWAARSLLEGRDYDRDWRRAWGGWLLGSVVNRMVYHYMGNRGMRWCLSRLDAGVDARMLLYRHYRATPLRRLLGPLARRWWRGRRDDQPCFDPECRCLWCRCGTS